MGSNIRNGVLVAFGIVVAAYGATFAWFHRAQPQQNSGKDAPAAVASPSDTTHSILAQTGQRFVLEVRGLGFTVGRDTNDEIWQAMGAKASNSETYRSQNPADYGDGTDARMIHMGAAESIAFEYGARHAVERWPVPVFVWGPPKDPRSSFVAAATIADARQKAGLGATLFLWQEDANTNDPVVMIEKLFAFFDQHRDVPEAILFSQDSSVMRDLLGPPGGGLQLPDAQFIPAVPDSFVVMVVSRSDRIDKLIRPFAVAGAGGANTDGDKLWDFFWDRTDGQGPDDFQAFYRKQVKAERPEQEIMPALGTMQSSWWQQQLPTFWKTISNKGPGQFTPTPYLPVRWTEGQVRQFDSAPLIGYLHRPVDVKLTADHGRPLKTAEQAEALKAGWEQALATLPQGTVPKRVFYDTTGDRQWAIPLTQAFAVVGATAPDLGNVHEGYDIGRRIADTGVSSAMVQMGLGLIAGYSDGAASATIARRPDGRATIIMVSPPDPARKAEWEKSHNNANPFD